MGSHKRSHTNQRSSGRTRTTRSQKGRSLVADPEETGAQLTQQLSSLGLYAADTVGDGNCLFRALSDQYYGSPSRHVVVRRDVCDWIQGHPEGYEGFVDEDEFGTGSDKKGKGKLDRYLGRMRENATYGGHMELSAFAHLTRRNIKVVQPGLVYVIQWNPDSSKSQSKEESDNDSDAASDRHTPRKRNTKERRDKRAPATESDDEEDKEDGPTIYVAYHDWEHFSSIRNLKGPHAGLPCIEETSSPPPPPTPLKKKLPRVHLRMSSTTPQDPVRVPLPPSMSATPAASRAMTPLPPGALHATDHRTHRSPKRSLEESSASSEGSEMGTGKRQRTRSTLHQADEVMEVDPVINDSSSSEASDDESTNSAPLATPFLSPASSQSCAFSSLSSLSTSPDLDDPTAIDSPLSSLPSTPEPEAAPSPQPAAFSKEKALTRRQRKKLGLPKERPVSAGKITIPGGRFLKNRAADTPQVAVQGEQEEGPDVEWKRNGTGRVDVRGFRELKI